MKILDKTSMSIIISLNEETTSKRVTKFKQKFISHFNKSNIMFTKSSYKNNFRRYVI